MIKTYKDPDVFKVSYELAMDIFLLSKKFPKEETYTLPSQVIRSSRSISANFCEGWGKRNYENVFKQHLVISMGSCYETENWLNFALDCKYITQTEFENLNTKLDSIGKMLNGLYKNWKSSNIKPQTSDLQK
jgi:four helix bundle protein